MGKIKTKQRIIIVCIWTTKCIKMFLFFEPILKAKVEITIKKNRCIFEGIAAKKIASEIIWPLPAFGKTI